MEFQHPMPFVSIFVQLKDVAMIVRMHIETQIGGIIRLFMRKFSDDVSCYRIAEFVSIPFCQSIGVGEELRAGQFRLFEIPRISFMPCFFDITDDLSF